MSYIKDRRFCSAQKRRYGTKIIHDCDRHRCPFVAGVCVLFRGSGGDAGGCATPGEQPERARRPDCSARASRAVPCHGRRGQSPNPKASRFPRIAERYPDNNPAPVLIDGTVVRHPGMPEFRLLENETDGLVAYIRRISRQWRP